ncbi:hypothetical protein JB92DRAFT_2729380, partial [Gautieria morchelliformis]
LDKFCLEFKQLYVQDHPDHIHMACPCLVSRSANTSNWPSISMQPGNGVDNS